MHVLLVALLALGPAPPAAAPIAEADVRALVGAWAAAQNAGDLPAYEGLFAARFTGVRRSGARTRTFDRAGWLRDRGRMFRKPMVVRVAALDVRVAGASALVSFTQTFTQGTYEDTGPKQLVVVREGDALKIASEKLLRSELLSAPVAADERFRFVVEGALLLAEAPDEGWAAGPIALRAADDDGDRAVAERRVDGKRLPPELARWRGRRVRLVDAGGTACDATVKGFRILSRSIPHFSTRAEWNNEPPRTKEGKAAKEAWALGAKVLVGDIDHRCEGALWAQPAAQAPAPSDLGEEGNPALRALAVRELRRSEAWRTIQTSYLEDAVKGVKRWDELDGVDTKVRRFHARKGGKQIELVSITLSLWESCAGFGADLWGLYETRAGKLLPRNKPGGTAVLPVAAIDSDGDGNSELLFEPVGSSFGTEMGRVLLDGEEWNKVEEVAVPYMDCPC